MASARKSLAIALIIMGFLMIGATFVIHSTAFHRYLLRFAETTSGWKLTTQNSHISILRGLMSFDGFEAHDPKGKIDLRVDHFSVNLSSLSLIRGKLIVTDVEFIRPSLFVRKKENPEPIKFDPQVLEKFFHSYEKSFVLQNLYFDDIRIQDLNVETSEGGKFFVQKASLHIVPTLLRELKADVRLENPGGNPKIALLEVKTVLKKDALKLDRIFLQTSKAEVALQGVLKGFKKGEAEIIGTVKAPIYLEDEINAKIEAQLEPGLIKIKKIHGSLGKAVLDGQGYLDPDTRKYDIQFNAKDLTLESMFQKIPGNVMGPARGVATVEGEASGTLPALEAHAKATIRDFHHTVMAANTLDGTLHFHWPELDFDANIRPGTKDFQGKAKGGVAFKTLPGIPGKKAVVKDISVVMTRASLEDLLPTFNVKGFGTANLTLKGAGLSTEGQARVQLFDVESKYGGLHNFSTDIRFKPQGKLTFQNTEAVPVGAALIRLTGDVSLDTEPEDKITFEGQPLPGFTFNGAYQRQSKIFRVDRLSLQRNGSDLKGSLSYEPSGQITAEAKGRMNIEWLNALPKFFREASGMVQCDLNVSGSTKDPVLRGLIRFLKTDLSFRNFPETFSELEGTLNINGNTITPQMTGLLGDGSFVLEGRSQWDHFKPEEFDLKLRGRNLTVSHPGVYHLDLDADVTLKGRMPSPRLEGRIDILDGVYSKPFDFRDLVLKPSNPGESDEVHLLMDPIELNLAVKNSGDMRIKNNIADILLTSDLRILGTIGNPRLMGAVTVTEGEFEFLGKEFQINEGRLEYIDPSRREPYLTLLAQREVPPDFTVFTELKGFLSNLEMKLSSTPSLGREDIISLIAFGLTADEVRESGRSRRALGSDILAGELSSLLGNPLSKRTGLDILKLEASEEGSLSRISIGKNVTDRLSVEFSNDFAPETAQRVIQANYFLTDNVLFKGFREWKTGESPRFNFNMSFRFRAN